MLYVYFWYRVHGYRRYCTSSISLCGKTVIVTGGNSGIGKETAIDLARRGARVILACRNPNLAEEAVKEVSKRSKSTNVTYRHLDLNSLESVRNFATGFLEEEERLDILVNNAGKATLTSGGVTVDGFESVFGINHFGHFLLTLLLLERLKKCSPSRVVMVTSNFYEYVTAIDFKPKSPDGLRYPGLNDYAYSKAANVMFTRELARRLKGTEVTAYSVHPGFVYTNITVKSAQGNIHCAVDESITDLSGSLSTTPTKVFGSKRRCYV
ncbi:retinol dehydrogenase 12-like [Amphiura filiformis]|uniref:retinol dehydrogenase 12-like n=1 Tax=Amphiura filiformis TaxID=82378 RepID=UPI003B2166DB